MNRTHLSIFNQWLDALSGGRSTPPEPASSDAPLLNATSAARQLHDLAWRTDAAPVNRSLPPTWEEFMHAHHIEAPSPVTRSGHSAPRASGTWRPGHAGAFDALSGRPARLASNAILAVIVIAVVLAGGWKAADTFRPVPPEAPSGIPFAGFLQDEGTPLATDVDLLAPATADQCTIAPLTIDEVIAIVHDPWAVTTGEEVSDSVMVPATPAGVDNFYIATPDLPDDYVHEPAYATDEALAGVTATFHMFEACIEANSYFQFWATLSPTLIQQSILAVLPPLTGEDDLRALLTDLEANGPAEPGAEDGVFWPLTFTAPNGSSVAEGRISRVVDQNPENTWMPETHFLVAGYTSYLPDGTAIAEFQVSIYDSDFDGTPEPLVGYDPRLKQPSCFSIIFSWSDERDMWLIQQYPTCG